MTRTHRTNSAYAALAVLTAYALWSTPTFAQGNWPSKPIRLVVPFAARGANDLTARSAAEGTSKTWTPRISAFPPLSTAVEQGFAEVQIAHWAGIHSPAGTPVAVIDKMAVAVDKVMTGRRRSKNSRDWALNRWAARAPSL